MYTYTQHIKLTFDYNSIISNFEQTFTNLEKKTHNSFYPVYKFFLFYLSTYMFITIITINILTDKQQIVYNSLTKK